MQNQEAIGQPIDFTAHVQVQAKGGESADAVVKVNEPLRVHGTDVYLLGNGYAPTITVRDPEGKVVFTDSVPFLPQDANLTSIGVVKVPDGLEDQLGMVGFFYPTQSTLGSGAYTSSYPDLVYPVLTLNVYQGDLGIDEGTPTSVYTLDPSTMEQLTGGATGVDSLELMPGDTVELPNGPVRSPSRARRRMPRPTTTRRASPGSRASTSTTTPRRAGCSPSRR